MDYTYGYNPTDIDSEIFLADEPFRLLKQHIRSQFKNPMDLTIDYIGNFIETYSFSRSIVETDEEDLKLDQFRDEFYQFMQNIFSKVLDIEFPEFDVLSEEDQFDILHMTYRYFIINVKHNFSNYCINYIDNNKELIASTLDEKSDITSLGLKNYGVDKIDVLILSNLFDIIKTIIDNEETDIVDFVNASDWHEPWLETELMQDRIETNEIVGNFYPKYKNLLSNEVLREIEGKVRNKILKKYKNNERVVVSEGEDNENNNGSPS